MYSLTRQTDVSLPQSYQEFLNPAKREENDIMLF